MNFNEELELTDNDLEMVSGGWGSGSAIGGSASFNSAGGYYGYNGGSIAGGASTFQGSHGAFAGAGGATSAYAGEATAPGYSISLGGTQGLGGAFGGGF